MESHERLFLKVIFFSLNPPMHTHTLALFLSLGICQFGVSVLEQLEQYCVVFWGLVLF